MKTDFMAFTTSCIKCGEHKRRGGGQIKMVNGRQRFVCRDCIEEAEELAVSPA